MPPDTILEVEKRSLAEQRQQMEKERLAQLQDNSKKPDEQLATAVSELLPEVSKVGIDCHKDEEEGDSTSLNGNSVK